MTRKKHIKWKLLCVQDNRYNLNGKKILNDAELDCYMM